MTDQWAMLDAEIRQWKAAGLRLPLWWRDDDAVDVTAALEQLLALSHQTGLPVSLAVIPNAATMALARRLHSSTATVLVHGWTHENHAPVEQKKAEFGPARPVSETTEDARAGLARLRELFGPGLAPVFVPPWNRITPETAVALPALGYKAVSTFTPRRAVEAAPGLLQINTHLDPIHWRGDRSLVPPARLIAQIAHDLHMRRLGQDDPTEPYGILTHHLVHDAAIWDFTHELISRLMDGIADAWTFEGP